jgi:hypothetical protein
MYCSLADVHTYLNIATGTTTDDGLLNSLIGAACQRIDDATKRRFEASADSTRYFDVDEDTAGRELCFYGDISHISSVVNDGTIPASDYVTDPRNETPWRSIKLKTTSPYFWSYTGGPEDAIQVSGRWAVMLRKEVSAIARATNVITVTLADTSGLAVGQKVYIAGVADSSFNTSGVLLTVADTSVTFAQTGTDDTDTTGALLFTPPSIRQAAIRLTAWLYRQKDTQGGDADRPILAGDGSVIMPQTLPGDVQSLLKEWVLKI